MNVTRNHCVVVNEPPILLGGQARPAATLTRAALLAADSEMPAAVRAASSVKLEPTSGGADQPLDFSVKSSSNSPSPPQITARSRNPVKTAESLLMLSQTGVQSSCSSSSSNEQQRQQLEQRQQQRPIATARSRRKSAGVQRRGLATQQHDQTDGLLVVSQGDSASPAWQSSSTNMSTGVNAVSSVNADIINDNSSPSQSNESFSPSSNGGIVNNTVKLSVDERRHRQSSSSSSHNHQQLVSSIPPDSTTASMDGDDDNGERIKVRTANGVVNRRRPRAMPDEKKDESYWERRRKNNEAAKRSRDARRQKEDDVAFHCRQLEQENKRLRDEIAELRAVIEQLRAEVLARQQQSEQSDAVQLIETERANRENSENCDPVVEQPRRLHENSSSEAPVVRAASAPDDDTSSSSSSSGDESDGTSDNN